jgi:hypothetical protein
MKISKDMKFICECGHDEFNLRVKTISNKLDVHSFICTHCKKSHMHPLQLFYLLRGLGVKVDEVS